jgi:hypothetical protein
MTVQVRIVIFLCILAYALSQGQDPPAPEPAPQPSSSVNLRGMFVGETAGQDAATLSALCQEIADEIEWDGKQSEPYLTTGVAFDVLRTRAREARMRGVSIGDRQPRVRDAISEYLDDKVGGSGGPVSEESRRNWVAAYSEIARACKDAIK